MSQQLTKRELNTCPQCDHTWYPKGHDLSKKCPHCGHNDVVFEYSNPQPCKTTIAVVAGILTAGLIFPIPGVTQTAQIVVGVPCAFTEAAIEVFVTGDDNNFCGNLLDR